MPPLIRTTAVIVPLPFIPDLLLFPLHLPLSPLHLLQGRSLHLVALPLDLMVNHLDRPIKPHLVLWAQDPLVSPHLAHRGQITIVSHIARFLLLHLHHCPRYRQLAGNPRAPTMETRITHLRVHDSPAVEALIHLGFAMWDLPNVPGTEPLDESMIHPPVTIPTRKIEVTLFYAMDVVRFRVVFFLFFSRLLLLLIESIQTYPVPIYPYDFLHIPYLISCFLGAPPQRCPSANHPTCIFLAIPFCFPYSLLESCDALSRTILLFNIHLLPPCIPALSLNSLLSHDVKVLLCHLVSL